MNKIQAICFSEIKSPKINLKIMHFFWFVKNKTYSFTWTKRLVLLGIKDTARCMSSLFSPQYNKLQVLEEISSGVMSNSMSKQLLKSKLPTVIFCFGINSVDLWNRSCPENEIKNRNFLHLYVQNFEHTHNTLRCSRITNTKPVTAHGAG